MDRQTVTQKIIGAKVKKGLKWADIADRIGQSKEWTTAACLGQMTFTKAQAEVAQDLFELSDEEAAWLQSRSFRTRARCRRLSRPIR
jgi:cyanate lyase